MTQGNTSGGRPKVMMATLPSTLPVFRPTRRRSHFRNRVASHKGTANGIRTTHTGQISPKCRVFGRADVRRAWAARDGPMPGPSGSRLDVLTGAPRMFVVGMGKLPAFDRWPATAYLTSAASYAALRSRAVLP
jgi:hypothetical protein